MTVSITGDAGQDGTCGKADADTRLHRRSWARHVVEAKRVGVSVHVRASGTYVLIHGDSKTWMSSITREPLIATLQPSWIIRGTPAAN